MKFKVGDLIFWKSDDRSDEVNHFGIILSRECIKSEDPRLNVHFTFFKGSEQEIEPVYNVLWIHKDISPYVSIVHKDFTESWFEVVNETG